MQEIPPDTKLSVELTAQEWNILFGLLADVQAPYRVTAPLLTGIQQQLTEQVQGTGKSDVSSQDQG
jgi:hypothetical protein